MVACQSGYLHTILKCSLFISKSKRQDVLSQKVCFPHQTIADFFDLKLTCTVGSRSSSFRRTPPPSSSSFSSFAHTFSTDHVSTAPSYCSSYSPHHAIGQITASSTFLRIGSSRDHPPQPSVYQTTRIIVSRIARHRIRLWSKLS